MPQHTNLDSSGVGDFDAWTIRFECGLEVAIWIFHQRADFSRVTDPGEPGNVEIHASDLDRGHVLFHLGYERESMSLWVPDQGRDDPERWHVRRLDDNGCEFAARSVSSRCEAKGVLQEFEALGHKQTYWVVERD